MEFSKRMAHLQPGVFSVMANKKRKRLEQGLRVIDLGIGAPNIPPAPHVIDALATAVMNQSNYVYAVRDLGALREAAVQWYSRRFDVELNVDSQVIALLGEQDGLSHIALSIVDPGDLVLIPDPFYPAFATGPLIAGAELYTMPQRRENGYLIDLDEIPPEIAGRAKLMIVSYPNNPTTAIAPERFYDALVAFAQRYDIIVLHDNAYSELVFDGKTGGSFLSREGAADVGVEFNSLSKPFGLAGARVGFCLGNKDICKNLETLKSNLDYGIFLPVQMAAIAALTGSQGCVARTCAAYQRRRDALCDGLSSIGWPVERPAATMFVWTRLPEPFTDARVFCDLLLERSGVLMTPGDAFGKMGEGHVRMALVQDEEVLAEAIAAIHQSGILSAGACLHTTPN